MKAMILAAGLGTRLRPYTEHKPKALVEIAGKPLLAHSIEKLHKHGFRDIVINIHHFGDLILDFLAKQQFPGINIQISDERDLLLDTGGGIKKALPFFDDEPFLLYNTDILTDLDLAYFFKYHLEKEAMVTLAIRKRESSRYLLFNDALMLVGWEHAKKQVQKICRPNLPYQRFAFSGIHVINPKIVNWMPEEKVFSIIDVYLHAGKESLIQGFDHTNTHWIDVGRIPDLERAQSLMHLFE